MKERVFHGPCRSKDYYSSEGESSADSTPKSSETIEQPMTSSLNGTKPVDQSNMMASLNRTKPGDQKVTQMKVQLQPQDERLAKVQAKLEALEEGDSGKH